MAKSTIKTHNTIAFRVPVPPTRATRHSILYLTEGEAIMTIGSETYTICKNECLIVPAGQVYSFANPDINKGHLLYRPENSQQNKNR